ncbi:MAG: hypothetical protein ACI3ZF_05225 [Candidatus Cryptobacteroides sp.]
MKKVLLYIMSLVALISCVKPDERERDSANELRSLKAYVYYDQQNLNLYEEVDLLSGVYLEDKGLASYTFPSDEEKFNSFSLSRCRLEASIPSTAVLRMTDENGVEKNCGIGAWHNLFNTSLYFNIVADNGDVRKFKMVCRCAN